MSLRAKIALLPDCHLRPSKRETSIPAFPTKRLYGFARMLLETYLRRLGNEVDAIFLLGDTLDPATPEGLDWLKEQIRMTPCPVHLVIGNHETFGEVRDTEFYRAFDLPSQGNYMVRVKDIPFLMLATPSQGSFWPNSIGFQWLANKLKSLVQEDVFCCAHYSLVLHPCVQGYLNDGMQVLHAGEKIIELFQQYPNVRGWFAGHKNIPSKVVKSGMLHLLSPQLIQAPCGYRILEIHDDKVVSTTHEIIETQVSDLSKEAYGREYKARCGEPDDRDFTWEFPSLHA